MTITFILTKYQTQREEDQEKKEEKNRETES